MSIHETLEKAIPDALRDKNEVRLRTLRSLVAAMTNEAIAKHANPSGLLTVTERIAVTHDRLLTDDQALVVIRRAANQRKDSIEQFEKAGRSDLSKGEKEELAIIQAFLPATMKREEIETAAHAKIKELKLTLKADRGVLMGALMKSFKGKADGADVKAVVDSLLS